MDMIIRVSPKSKRDAVDMGDDGTIRVRVTAAPERGKANAAVIRLLAKRLGVAKSAVAITRGLSSRHKTVRVEGMDAAEAVRRLGAKDRARKPEQR